MIQIGTTNWVRELKAKTQALGPDFWAHFMPASEADLRQIETRTGRKLDPEFREFYRTIGYGDFRDKTGYIGNIYSPEEVLQCIPNPIFFITGSMTPGEEWASLHEQVDLWLSRGRSNPDPKRFTDDILTLDDVRLYDLLQIGINGGCCYHQLYVGPEPAPLRYCLLTDSQEIEDRAMTFSEGLEKIVQRYLAWEEQDEN
jgi:hypothetical protein